MMDGKWHGSLLGDIFGKGYFYGETTQAFTIITN